MAESIPTVILCGGRGTRISEYNPTIPKPLVPIGNRPILWHIMKTYAHFGHNDFVLALGWLGEEIRRFFLQYEALTRDFTIEFGKHSGIEFLHSQPDDGWRVTCVDTGIESLTGTRVRRAAEHLKSGPIMVTYGDGVGPIDIDALLAYHRAKGKLATVTAVQPPSRFGELIVDSDGLCREFTEKPQTSTGAINGGFMVFEREALDRYFPADGDYMLEREPLNGLASDGQLAAFEHHGFWQCVDTPRERTLLDDLWESGQAPWQVWK
ncbi:MAG TPA: glucose-1-phosphate cytidylyltransferase [Acidimicrobiales bacterium]|jgi:glucose-1-phosphate cytidylyltransferase|nr:glucose-1-phosphate cytidylyltransferase [Acidimicrobiales bacterium]